MDPGKRTTRHWMVGRRFAVSGYTALPPSLAPLPPIGECVSVTPWGNDRIRWIRLRFEDGTQKSYAPTHLILLAPDGVWRAP